MIGTLREMARGLDSVVQSLCVEQLSPTDAADVLRAAAAVERRAAVLKTLVAQRATQGGNWTAGGHRSAESWLGEQIGAGWGSAKATLGASEKLGELAGFDEAARSGELSDEQMKEIGAAADASNEQELLDAARSDNADELRKKCKRAKAKARTDNDERARHERAHRERSLREWTDNHGAWCGGWKGTAMDGARFRSRLAEETDRLFKRAYAEGRREPLTAYRYDAFMNLVMGTAQGDVGPPKRRDEVIIRVDASRLAGLGEGICETSTGAVPVDEAIGAILAGAFVKVVLVDGVDITKVVHVGSRGIPALLRTAVFERDGHKCVRCGCTTNLELHHYRVDFAKGGVTSYGNLATLCSFCHDRCSNDGFELRGGPGNWDWVAPVRTVKRE